MNPEASWAVETKATYGGDNQLQRRVPERQKAILLMVTSPSQLYNNALYCATS